MTKAKPRKKHQAELDFAKGFRAEAQRRMEVLIAERAKFPPTLVKTRKGWKRNPKFTDKMAAHMRSFGFKSEQIVAELREKGA